MSMRYIGGNKSNILHLTRLQNPTRRFIMIGSTVEYKAIVSINSQATISLVLTGHLVDVVQRHHTDAQ